MRLNAISYLPRQGAGNIQPGNTLRFGAETSKAGSNEKFFRSTARLSMVGTVIGFLGILGNLGTGIALNKNAYEDRVASQEIQRVQTMHDQWHQKGHPEMNSGTASNVLMGEQLANALDRLGENILKSTPEDTDHEIFRYHFRQWIEKHPELGTYFSTSDTFDLKFQLPDIAAHVFTHLQHNNAEKTTAANLKGVFQHWVNANVTDGPGMESREKLLEYGNAYIDSLDAEMAFESELGWKLGSSGLLILFNMFLYGKLRQLEHTEKNKRLQANTSAPPPPPPPTAEEKPAISIQAVSVEAVIDPAVYAPGDYPDSPEALRSKIHGQIFRLLEAAARDQVQVTLLEDRLAQTEKNIRNSAPLNIIKTKPGHEAAVAEAVKIRQEKYEASQRKIELLEGDLKAARSNHAQLSEAVQVQMQQYDNLLSHGMAFDAHLMGDYRTLEKALERKHPFLLLNGLAQVQKFHVAVASKNPRDISELVAEVLREQKPEGDAITQASREILARLEKQLNAKQHST